MATSYADSAQARESDRRHDQWGNPVVPRHAHCHDYDATAEIEARKVRDAAYRKSFAIRLGGALGQLEAFYKPRGNQ